MCSNIAARKLVDQNNQNSCKMLSKQAVAGCETVYLHNEAQIKERQRGVGNILMTRVTPGLRGSCPCSIRFMNRSVLRRCISFTNATRSSMLCSNARLVKSKTL